MEMKFASSPSALFCVCVCETESKKETSPEIPVLKQQRIEMLFLLFFLSSLHLNLEILNLDYKNVTNYIYQVNLSINE